MMDILITLESYYNMKGKTVPVNAMMTCRGEGGRE
jgi:hypothetical protein